MVSRCTCRSVLHLDTKSHSERQVEEVEGGVREEKAHTSQFVWSHQGRLPGGGAREGTYSTCSVARPMVARLLGRVSEDGSSSSLDIEKETGMCKVSSPDFPNLESLVHLFSQTHRHSEETHTFLPSLPEDGKQAPFISAVLGWYPGLCTC